MLACTLLATASLLGLAAALAIDAPLGAWTRLGVGMVFGQVVLLWMPFGLALGLNLGARAAGLSALAVCSAGCVVWALWLRRSPARVSAWWSQLTAAGRAGHQALWILSIGLLGLLAYLHYTHYLLPRADGLHSAGVTWGDLPMHAALATRFLYAPGLPRLEHPLFLNGPLSYPFLPDYAAAILCALGLSLRWAFILAGVVAIAPLLPLLHGITRLWFDRDDRSVTTSVLGIGLFFFAGGLGFVFIGAGLGKGDSLIALLGSVNATYIDPWILKSGTIGNLFIAARTAAYGMPIGACALLLLGHALESGEKSRWLWIVGGGLIGALPLIHGHSFLALCLVAVVYSSLARRREVLACWAVLALFALPQLLWLATQRGSSHVHLTFGMLQPVSSALGWLRDVVLDLGVWVVLVPWAWIVAPPRARRLSAPLLLLLPIANVVSFTAADYDNVKLLAWFDLGAAPLVAAMLVRRFGRGTSSVLQRTAAGVVLVLACTLSGLLAVGHELSNDALVMSYADRRFADFVALHTQPDDVIATGASYHDPVAMFAGRRVVLATPSMLGTHGIDALPRARELLALYRGGPDALEVIKRLRIDAVVVGPHERQDVPRVNEAFLGEHACEIDGQGERRLYKLCGVR
jgi:hypothetical protein